MRRALLAALACLAALPAWAQGFNMGKGGDTPIQVYADDGIEWIADASRVIAKGNAKAVRGDVTLTADSLTAYYREGKGGNEIWRLDADGNVTIKSPNETATGSKATYDLDKAIVVLRGQPAKLVTPTQTITGQETLEYWEAQRMAVARGDAVAIDKDRKIQSDVLTAHFSENKKDKLDLSRADAYGHVVLTTPTEQVTGERGDYNAETGIATVTGSVKITRGDNQLNGGYAHVNLNTGISKLFGSTPGKDGPGRVSGTFTPEKQGSPDKQDPQQRRATFGGPSGGGPSGKSGQ